MAAFVEAARIPARSQEVRWTLPKETGTQSKQRFLLIVLICCMRTGMFPEKIKDGLRSQTINSRILGGASVTCHFETGSRYIA